MDTRSLHISPSIILVALVSACPSTSPNGRQLSAPTVHREPPQSDQQRCSSYANFEELIAASSIPSRRLGRQQRDVVLVDVDERASACAELLAMNSPVVPNGIIKFDSAGNLNTESMRDIQRIISSHNASACRMAVYAPGFTEHGDRASVFLKMAGQPGADAQRFEWFILHSPGRNDANWVVVPDCTSFEHGQSAQGDSLAMPNLRGIKDRLSELESYVDAVLDSPAGQGGARRTAREIQAIGLPVPHIRLSDGGRTISLTDAVAGSPSVVNFWATHCPPCVDELPELLSLRVRLREHGARLVLVSEDYSASDVSAFEGRLGTKLSSYIAVGEGRRGRGLAPFSDYAQPLTLVVSPTGRVLSAYEGRLGKDEIEEIERSIRAMTER